MRYLTAGDAHGPGLVCVVEGMPAGVPVDLADLEHYLTRRRTVAGRSERMHIEDDRAEIWGGLHDGHTTAAPLAILIHNRAGRTGQAACRTIPRPGHADLAAAVKYGLDDLTPVQERASARETAARCAAGFLAGRLLEELGMRVCGLVAAIGPVAAPAAAELYDQPPDDEGWAMLAALAESSPVRCPWPEAAAMLSALEAAARAGESLGGVVLVVATGVPVGLGSHVHGDRRLDGRIAGAVMSIPAVKGVEVGLGFAAAARPSAKCHDPIGPGWARPTARAGGIEGGMTCGGPLVVRAAVKPVPTLPGGLPSIDLATGEARGAPVQRSDICAAPAAAVVAEAAVRWELAQAVVDRWGGDTLDGIVRAARGGGERK